MARKGESMNKENIIDILDKCITDLVKWDNFDIDDDDLSLNQLFGAYLGLHHAMLQNIAEILKVVAKEVRQTRR